jgi:hypothetical protein
MKTTEYTEYTEKTRKEGHVILLSVFSVYSVVSNYGSCPSRLSAARLIVRTPVRIVGTGTG